MLYADVNFVEIDLLGAGTRVSMRDDDQSPAPCHTPYRICVYRGWLRRRFQAYPASPGQPLPAIRIPLRESDQDVILQLQSLIEQEYENSGYEDIDYSVDLPSPLFDEDRQWLNDIVRKAGLR